MKQQMQAIIDRMHLMGAPVESGAFFRKFEAAPDEDLESMLEDLMMQLESLNREKKADSNG
jgi:hypothetical protein